MFLGLMILMIITTMWFGMFIEHHQWWVALALAILMSAGMMVIAHMTMVQHFIMGII